MCGETYITLCSTRWEWAGWMQSHFPSIVRPRLTDGTNKWRKWQSMAGCRGPLIGCWLAADWPVKSVHYHAGWRRAFEGLQKARCSTFPSFWHVRHCRLCAIGYIRIHYLSIIDYLDEFWLRKYSFVLNWFLLGFGLAVGRGYALESIFKPGLCQC